VLCYDASGPDIISVKCAVAAAAAAGWTVINITASRMPAAVVPPAPCHPPVSTTRTPRPPPSAPHTTVDCPPQVHLCPTCVAHLRNIVIANERRGNGAGVDFFVGDPGSSLKLEDSYRLRLACTTSGTQQLSLIPAVPLSACPVQQRHARPGS
jgi:hypothetical protein